MLSRDVSHCKQINRVVLKTQNNSSLIPAVGLNNINYIPSGNLYPRFNNNDFVNKTQLGWTQEMWLEWRTFDVRIRRKVSNYVAGLLAKTKWKNHFKH